MTFDVCYKFDLNAFPDYVKPGELFLIKDWHVDINSGNHYFYDCLQSTGKDGWFFTDDYLSFSEREPFRLKVYCFFIGVEVFKEPTTGNSDNGSVFLINNKLGYYPFERGSKLILPMTIWKDS